MNFPREGIKLTRLNFQAVGEKIGEGLAAGNEYRLKIEPYREKRTLSQNALAHCWFTELSKYLIKRGRSGCSPEWVKDALKATYLGFEETEFIDVITGQRTTRETLRKTSKLKTGEMFDFMTKVHAWALDIGCMLTTPEHSEFMQNKQKQDE